jgi:GNAT superfamily N-acetyltransferase
VTGDVTADPPQPPPSALTDALERNFADIQAHYARGVGGVVRDLADVRMSRSGLPARVVNAVNRARFADGARTVEAIAEAKAFFDEAGVPFRWLVGPSSPPDLAARLTEAGLPRLSDTPGMALDLDRMNDEPVRMPGLDVREVASADDLEDWLGVSRASAGFDAVIFGAWRDAHRALGWGPGVPLHNFVARLDGRPVGVSALLDMDGVAGIWNVGVLEEVRGRGIGREATLAALRLARDLGLRTAILGSSPLGVPVYTRIGFVEVCRVRHHGAPIT